MESKERTQSRKRENRMSKSVVEYREEEEPTQEDIEDERDVSEETVHTNAAVPVIRVRLLQSVNLLPRQSLPVLVKVDCHDYRKPLLLEYDKEVDDAIGLQVENAILNPSRKGVAEVVVTNPSGFTKWRMKVSVLEEESNVVESIDQEEVSE